MNRLLIIILCFGAQSTLANTQTCNQVFSGALTSGGIIRSTSHITWEDNFKSGDFSDTRETDNFYRKKITLRRSADNQILYQKVYPSSMWVFPSLRTSPFEEGAFSNKTHVIGDSRGKLEIFQVVRNELREVMAIKPQSSSERVQGLGFSPDSRYFLSATINTDGLSVTKLFHVFDTVQGTVRSYNVESINRKDLSGSPSRVKFTADNNYLFFPSEVGFFGVMINLKSEEIKVVDFAPKVNRQRPASHVGMEVEEMGPGQIQLTSPWRETAAREEAEAM